EFSKFRWGQSHLRQYFLWALAPVLALLLFQILWRVRRQRHRRPAPPQSYSSRPGLDSEFYALEEALRKRGVLRNPGESLTEWLRRAMREPALGGLQKLSEPLLALHYRYRFDPRGLNQSQRVLLRQKAVECLQYLQTSPPDSRDALRPAR